MIKAIIVDDEQHCINALLKLVEPISNTIKITNTFNSVDEALLKVQEISPDLVFLDVQINDKTGFDFLEELETIPFEVIFTTAHEKYAVQAFKFSAVDYLLKPIDEDDFTQAISKLNLKIEAKDFSKKVKSLLSNVTKNDGQKRITIPTSEGLEFLDVADIIRCESDVNYTTIYTNDKRSLVVSKTLKWFETLLQNAGFFRIHNSHLINLSYIKKYTKGKGGYVTLSDDSNIEVSTRKKEGFIKALEFMM
ncbi:MAG: response regulator transcription factor [Winogradskyella sp.]|nr:DNA-binding response regulator [Flavobacteriaceae bacterium]MCB0398549.1 response regulator transcription factor [Winogradskyella sp.]|tara:strand:- start:795 stop:1544 length:750 start_codon:yes stop_codon:yes gene_type:complete